MTKHKTTTLILVAIILASSVLAFAFPPAAAAAPAAAPLGVLTVTGCTHSETCDSNTGNYHQYDGAFSGIWTLNDVYAIDTVSFTQTDYDGDHLTSVAVGVSYDCVTYTGLGTFSVSLGTTSIDLPDWAFGKCVVLQRIGSTGGGWSRVNEVSFDGAAVSTVVPFEGSSITPSSMTGITLDSGENTYDADYYHAAYTSLSLYTAEFSSAVEVRNVGLYVYPWDGFYMTEVSILYEGTVIVDHYEVEIGWNVIPVGSVVSADTWKVRVDAFAGGDDFMVPVLRFFGEEHTPTAAASATFTPSATPTITLTPTITPTFTPAVVISQGNYLQDGSFASNPALAVLGLSPWLNSFWDVGRYTFAPSDMYTPFQQVVEPVCGETFYQMDVEPGSVPLPGEFDHTGVYVEQGFDWPEEKNMFISLAARTSDPDTFATVQMFNPGGSVSVLEPSLTNTSGGWQFFYWEKASAQAGRYTFRVNGGNVGSTGGHVAVDMAAVHEGYWQNDCGSETEPYWQRDTVTNITATPGPGAGTVTQNPSFLTQLAGNLTLAFNGTSTQGAVAAGTATKAAQSTGTRQAIVSTQGWQTATKIAQGVQTLVAGGQGTQAVRTQTAQAYGMTATQSSARTATEFVGNWRGSLTAAAGRTATSVAIGQTQAAGVVATRVAVQATYQAAATATAQHGETEEAVPPIYQQLTLQAQIIRTNSAVLTQQAGDHGTAIMQLTNAATISATANATTIAQVTQNAALEATLRALATLQVTQSQGQGQGPVIATAVATTLAMPPLQNAPDVITADVDCNRPDNPYNLAWWIEYEVCRVMWYVTPNQANMQQIFDMSANLETYEPWGTINEVETILEDVQVEFAKYDWNDTGLPDSGGAFPQIAYNPDDPPTTNQVAILMPASEVPLLNGQIDLTGEVDYVFQTDCTLKITYLIGPYVTPSICFLVDVTRSKGYLPAVRLMFDLGALWMLYKAFRRWLQEVAGDPADNIISKTP